MLCARHDGLDKDQLVRFRQFANPNVTVTINGQTLGQLTRQYTGATDCASMGGVVTPGTMLHTTLELGKTYDIEWNYNDSRSDADDLAANVGRDCELPIRADRRPVGIAPQGL
jgi:hypothetical protein